ncbi:hypothetical protein BC833DRAFT_644792 [Globomyces pollinis-pini]|nr:hypothetical protein BC833DRAFT_644792 [Globomyces pollinis-pini]
MRAALDCMTYFIDSYDWIHDAPDAATFTKVLVNLIPKLTIENLPYLLDCLPRLFNRAENVFLPELKIIGNLLNTHSENSVIVEKLVRVFTSLYAVIWNDEQDLKEILDYLVEKLSYFFSLGNENHINMILSNMRVGFPEDHIQQLSDNGVLDQIKYYTTVDNPDLSRNAVRGCSVFIGHTKYKDHQTRDSDPVLLQWIIDLLLMENDALTEAIIRRWNLNCIIELAITTDSVLLDILLNLLPHHSCYVLPKLITLLENELKPTIKAKAERLLIDKGYHIALRDLSATDDSFQLTETLRILMKAEPSIIDVVFDNQWITTTLACEQPNYSANCDILTLFFDTLGKLHGAKLILWIDRGLLDIMETFYKCELKFDKNLQLALLEVLKSVLNEIDTFSAAVDVKPRLLAFLRFLVQSKSINYFVSSSSLALLSHFAPEGTEVASNPIYSPDYDINDFPFEPTEKPRCVMELKLLLFLATIRNKDQWWLKVQDSKIVQKWTDEAINQDYSIEIIQYAFNILIHASKSDIFENKFGLLQKDIVKRTVVSDNIVEDKLLESFLKQVSMLENDSNDNKDFHPFTNEQVRNLIHPSMYCLVYKKSKILPPNLRETMHSLPDSELLFKNAMVALPPNFEAENDRMYASKCFQWIPSEFSINQNGDTKITSYINNLNPIKHKEMYRTLEKIFEKFIPMFEIVLGSESELYISDPFADYDSEDFPPEHEEDEDEEEENEESDEGDGGEDDQEVDEGTGDEDDKEAIKQNGKEMEDEEMLLKKKRNRYTAIPILYEPAENVKQSVNLKDRNVQVIVKMANIHLTPENPKYNGGSWHIEGTPNESIVATGIYYYDQENITTSNISFRTVCDHEYYFDFNYPERGSAIEMVLGYSGFRYVEKTQFLGTIECKLGRCIVFPNKYQHQVQPFELKDKTKPGHRKILVFFLVNPNTSIVSTAHIAPQQLDWYTIPQQDQLPREICNHIKSMIEGTFTEAEAKAYRLKLMKERSLSEHHFQKNVAYGICNLCEH